MVPKSDIFEQMVDAAPIGICTVSSEGRFLRVNPMMCEMLGYSAEELLKIDFVSLTHPEDRAFDFSHFKAMLDGKSQNYRREKRYIRKDGTVLWVDLSSTIVFTEDKTSKQFITTLLDITLRKRIEESRRSSVRRFQTLFDQAPFSVQLFNRDGGTILVNQAWKDLWQADDAVVEEYVLKHYNVLKDPQLEEKGIASYIKDAFGGKSVVTPPIHYDPKKLGQEGRERWLSAQVHPLLDSNGEVVEVMLIHHDVTDRVEALAQLQKGKEAAEVANRIKSAFLANMSHEIRTPLGAILGFTEILRTQQTTPEEQQNFLEIIYRSGQGLIQIIDDILDLSKVEAGKLRLERSPVDLRQIVNDVVSLLKVKADSKDLQILVEEKTPLPSTISTDPVRVRQILINLLGNAVKFTDSGLVKVLLSHKENQIRIAIEDTGAGIAEADRSQLFQSFSQADNSHTRRHGGAGLGLVLSQKLANALGGELELDWSEVGRGSRFLLTHPLVATAEVPTAPAADEVPSVSASLEGKKILVVDDSPENRLLIQTLVASTKAQISVAKDGEEALRLVKSVDPDIVLMDIQMPVMDGLEATRRMRSQGFRKPIIALTAHAMKEDQQRSLDAGCTDHLCKPILRGPLLKALRLTQS